MGGRGNRQTSNHVRLLEMESLRNGTNRTAIVPSQASDQCQRDRPQRGAEGVITCCGAFYAGWSLYVKNGKPIFRYTCFEIADITIADADQIPEKNVTISTEFIPERSREGRGTLNLSVNGKIVGEGVLKRSLFRHCLEPFEVGRDSIA